MLRSFMRQLTCVVSNTLSLPYEFHTNRAYLFLNEICVSFPIYHILELRKDIEAFTIVIFLWDPLSSMKGTTGGFEIPYLLIQTMEFVITPEDEPAFAASGDYHLVNLDGKEMKKIIMPESKGKIMFSNIFVTFY